MTGVTNSTPVFLNTEQLANSWGALGANTLTVVSNTFVVNTVLALNTSSFRISVVGINPPVVNTSTLGGGAGVITTVALAIGSNGAIAAGVLDPIVCQANIAPNPSTGVWGCEFLVGLRANSKGTTVANAGTGWVAACLTPQAPALPFFGPPNIVLSAPGANGQAICNVNSAANLVYFTVAVGNQSGANANSLVELVSIYQNLPVVGT